MVAFLFLWLFGQAAIATSFTVWLWGRLVFRRRQVVLNELEQSPLADSYFWSALGATVFMGSVVIGASTRLHVILAKGLIVAGIDRVGIGTSLIGIVAGASMMIWAAVLNRSRRPWRAYLAASVLWIFCAPLLPGVVA